jgi:hypothetical protein
VSLAGCRPEYFAVRDARTLEPPAPDGRDLIALAAAWLGRTRPIDNLLIELPTREAADRRKHSGLDTTTGWSA